MDSFSLEIAIRIVVMQVYLDFIDDSFAKVQALRLVADQTDKKFVVK
jgi:hypothetical protein